MARVDIDLHRVNLALTTWDRDALHSLALDLLAAVPKTRQAAVLKRHLALDSLRAHPRPAQSALAEVKRFHEAALGREYFEPFQVNSKNYMSQSIGTQNFIAEYHRQAKQVAQQASAGADAQACEGFSLLLDLHSRVDDIEDIIFLADEHGAWQIGCDWKALIPLWLSSLQRVSDPAHYADTVLEMVEGLGYGKPAGLEEMAFDHASPEQQRELRDALKT